MRNNKRGNAAKLKRLKKRFKTGMVDPEYEDRDLNYELEAYGKIN